MSSSFLLSSSAASGPYPRSSTSIATDEFVDLATGALAVSALGDLILGLVEERLWSRRSCLGAGLTALIVLGFCDPAAGVDLGSPALFLLDGILWHPAALSPGLILLCPCG